VGWENKNSPPISINQHEFAADIRLMFNDFYMSYPLNSPVHQS
jgi:hypothetical protein